MTAIAVENNFEKIAWPDGLSNSVKEELSAMGWEASVHPHHVRLQMKNRGVTNELSLSLDIRPADLFLAVGVYNDEPRTAFCALMEAHVYDLNILAGIDTAVAKLMKADPDRLFVPATTAVKLIREQPERWEALRVGPITTIQAWLNSSTIGDR